MSDFHEELAAITAKVESQTTIEGSVMALGNEFKRTLDYAIDELPAEVDCDMLLDLSAFIGNNLRGLAGAVIANTPAAAIIPPKPPAAA